jgi:nucleobase:cation symporter-1, NCS1 family
VIDEHTVWLRFLDNDANGNGPNGATRFGVWFISASFILAQLGTNISANSVSAGCDLTALLPRFIVRLLLTIIAPVSRRLSDYTQNIRRGGYVAAIVGLAMCPWNLLKDSNSFTSYLSAYSVFLSSIAGVMITEYWIIRRGHYRVADLYSSKSAGWYHYNFGINWKAYAAYISGILINVVGFAGATSKFPFTLQDASLLRVGYSSAAECSSSGHAYLRNGLFHRLRYLRPHLLHSQSNLA